MAINRQQFTSLFPRCFNERWEHFDAFLRKKRELEEKSGPPLKRSRCLRLEIINMFYKTKKKKRNQEEKREAAIS